MRERLTRWGDFRVVNVEALARQDCRKRGRRKRLAEHPVLILKVYLTPSSNHAHSKGAVRVNYQTNMK
jgi:hypothetical protein